MLRVLDRPPGGRDRRRPKDPDELERLILACTRRFGHLLDQFIGKFHFQGLPLQPSLTVGNSAPRRSDGGLTVVDLDGGASGTVVSPWKTRPNSVRRDQTRRHEEILDWLKQGGRNRSRAVFCDEGISAIDRAVFFTWLASEWAYFSWVADDRNFWPRLSLDVFGEESDLLSFNEIYQQLRLALQELKLGNHLDDSETAWCYVESLRRQSGFPRAWWDCVHRIVQDHKHHRDVQDNWTILLQEGRDWPRSFSRKFPPLFR